MAKRKATTASGALDVDEWLAFHMAKRRRFALDRHPEAAALVREMLAALRDSPGGVSWVRVARFVRARYPDAPSHHTSYLEWAEHHGLWGADGA